MAGAAVAEGFVESAGVRIEIDVAAEAFVGSARVDETVDPWGWRIGNRREDQQVVAVNVRAQIHTAESGFSVDMAKATVILGLTLGAGDGLVLQMQTGSHFGQIERIKRLYPSDLGDEIIQLVTSGRRSPAPQRSPGVGSQTSRCSGFLLRVFQGPVDFIGAELF